MNKIKIIKEKIKYLTQCLLLIGFILSQTSGAFIFSGSTYFMSGFLCLVIYCIAKLFADSVIIEKFKYCILILISLNWFIFYYNGGTIPYLILLCILSVIAYSIAKIFEKQKINP